MSQTLLIVQIIVSLLLVISIVLQQRGASLGSAFGGSGEFHGTRRGGEKKLFYASIVLTGIFILLGIFNLLI